MKLNLGCGIDIRKGFVNVDMRGNVDVKHNLDKYPYPFKNDSIDFIRASHILEHLKEPLEFFKECRRILKRGGTMEVRVPHCRATGGAYGTFLHLHHFHEFAIREVTGKVPNPQFRGEPFALIETKVMYGRFLFWQKREIVWKIKKVKNEC